MSLPELSNNYSLFILLFINALTRFFVSCSSANNVATDIPASLVKIQDRLKQRNMFAAGDG